MTLIKAHQEVGNKWSEIAKRLPGRPENTIKNHWNTAKRRRNCESHDKNEHSSYEGSMLYAYAKKVAAIEEATKVLMKSISKKSKKVRRCNYDVYGGVMEKDAKMKRQMNKTSAKYWLKEAYMRAWFIDVYICVNLIRYCTFVVLLFLIKWYRIGNHIWYYRVGLQMRYSTLFLLFRSSVLLILH